MIKNNRGQMSMFLFVIMFAVFMLAIILLIVGIVSVKFYDGLNKNVAIGNVNLSTINDQTFGQINTMVLNNADWWGLAVIFGMIIGLFLSSYFIRNKFPKAGIILDIFIIFASFLVSLYLSSAYTTLLDALAGAGETFLETYTPKTSMFIKNLPVFVPIIGVVVMVLMHSSIPEKREEMLEGGFLQGVQ